MKKILFFVLVLIGLTSKAQVGLHRNDLQLGFSGGYTMNQVNFDPVVNQKWLNSPVFGITGRYICEKYFSIIGGVQLELNIAQTGWKEDIRDIMGSSVVNNITGQEEQYERRLTYLQVPLLAHLGFGREVKGVKFFVNVGPQLGILMSEKTKATFDYTNALDTDPKRATDIIAQDSLPVQNKFDYGLAMGLGLEYSHRHLGHLMFEARYYYGLGNIYNDSKSDYFGKSSFSTFVFKLTYLFDVIRTKGAQRK